MNRFIIILILIAVTSCTKESLNGTLDETIYVRHQGADMPVYVHGNSEKKTYIMAIHGAGSFGLSYRNEDFINRIESEYVVAYFDSRGHSMAQGHYSKSDDIIELMASDVKALAKVLKHKYGDDISLFLMGHSLGGLITAKALTDTEFQSQINGWINVDGLLHMPTVLGDRMELLYQTATQQINKGKNVEQWEAIQSVLEDTDIDSDDAYEIVFEQMKIAYVLIEEDGEIGEGGSAERLYQTIIKNNPITWQAMHLFNRPENFVREQNYTVMTEIESITLPSLFAYGQYDFSVPPAGGLHGFQEMGSTQKTYTLYNRTIHHPFVSESYNFTSELGEFVRRHR